MGERVVITVTGVDHPGIVAAVTRVLAENNANIEDISQTILQDLFTMIMIVNVEGVDMEKLRRELEEVEKEQRVKILVQHENIFRYMHRI
ncbi:MAG: hypothetical protein PWR13_1434 [Archaeoglobi archaeon]|nr:ACT domain-containing protein [Candidatus Mnemosynella bozhongmuii]MDK2782406.1 hypothetical protein [Archaeoglobi archaeon]